MNAADSRSKREKQLPDLDTLDVQSLKALVLAKQAELDSRTNEIEKAASNPASAEMLFKADFETGDLSQFSGKSKNIMPGDIEVVSDVVHSGKYAGR